MDTLCSMEILCSMETLCGMDNLCSMGTLFSMDTHCSMDTLCSMNTLRINFSMETTPVVWKTYVERNINIYYLLLYYNEGMY